MRVLVMMTYDIQKHYKGVELRYWDSPRTVMRRKKWF